MYEKFHWNLIPRTPKNRVVNPLFSSNNLYSFQPDKPFLRLELLLDFLPASGVSVRSYSYIATSAICFLLLHFRNYYLPSILWKIWPEQTSSGDFARAQLWRPSSRYISLKKKLLTKNLSASEERFFLNVTGCIDIQSRKP